jgi:hypothetical protein
MNKKILSLTIMSSLFFTTSSQALTEKEVLIIGGTTAVGFAIGGLGMLIGSSFVGEPSYIYSCDSDAGTLFHCAQVSTDSTHATYTCEAGNGTVVLAEKSNEYYCESNKALRPSLQIVQLSSPSLSFKVAGAILTPLAAVTSIVTKFLYVKKQSESNI